MNININNEQLVDYLRFGYYDKYLENEKLERLLKIKEECCLHQKTIDYDDSYISMVMCKGMLKNHIKEKISKMKPPISILLSGGVDSTVMLLLALECFQEKDIIPITAKFANKKYDESWKAKAVLNSLGFKRHEVFEINNEAVTKDIFDYRLNLLDQLFCSSSLIPTYAIYNFAKNFGNILTGDGGDELFAGYDRYIYDYFVVFKLIKFFVELIIKLFGSKNNRVNKAANYKKYGYPALFSIWQKSDVEKLGLTSIQQNSDILNRCDFIHSNEKIKHPIDRTMLIDISTELFGLEGQKISMASKLASVNPVSPFCDFDIIEFCCGININLKYKNNIRKILLREIIKEKISSYDKITTKRKKGFSTPIGEYIKTLQLDDFVTFDLNDKYINEIYNKHIEGKEDHSERLYSLYYLKKMVDSGKIN